MPVIVADALSWVGSPMDSSRDRSERVTRNVLHVLAKPILVELRYALIAM
jgi:hypothetical protein